MNRLKDHKNPDYIQWVNEYAPTITNLVLNLLNDYVAVFTLSLLSHSIGSLLL